MYPILGSLGPFTFHTYSVLINLGAVVALARLYLAAPEGRRSEWLDAGLAALVGGVAGARLGYVLANGAYFANHAGEAFAVWTGGLSWVGAVAGGLAGLWLFCARRGLSVLPLLDALALPIVLLAALGWGGCLAAGCAYGIEVVPGQFPPSLTAYAPDMFGLTLPRWPTQIAGLVYSLLALGLLYGLRGRLRVRGAFGVMSLLLVALGATLLGFTRADPVPTFQGLRLDTWASLTVLLASLIGFASLHFRPVSPPSTQPQPPISNL